MNNINRVQELKKEIQNIKVKIIVPLMLIEEKEFKIKRIQESCNHEFRRYKCVYLNGYIISCSKCGLDKTKP